MKHLLTFFLLIVLSLPVFSQKAGVVKFEDLEGRIMNSSDTLYVINFWATWCTPCVKEIPFFEQLAEKYKQEPLKVIFYSLDFKSKIEKEVIPFVRKNSIKSEVLVNQNNDEKFINLVSKEWSGAIPATLIINKKKGIRKFYEKEFDFNQLEELYLKSR
ncbi:Redoxin domain protein [Pseudopedobacter saltans DSM 12145]|uniref:Redoxin domain protein n=1 Tax=Pseudopedobacter saltans (strain ATCC 51119 / DSM 12145 / JCM 21818 / CCUG 39354 / LMG 10337 / NBRC 100064 / NCIMB 13643) TaxID=762903 RepID=F0SD21_PSESL|nr:TlpA disulfide reductase family protein [Pseudopedobacter saltans]ADY51778.1 Redoxin domain protein [Pseudopedobacter saltans DSM 12145]